VTAAPAPTVPARVTLGLGVALAAFTLSEVNYPRLGPQAQLAIFAMLGLVLGVLHRPSMRAGHLPGRVVDVLLIGLTVFCCGYVVHQTEPTFAEAWIGGQSLGNRAGQEPPLDVAVGLIGLVLIVEATRRAIGLALPLLSLAFLAYASFGPYLPGWLFPHRGYAIDRIVAQTFLHSQGVFGVALSVMFTYVFLFVLFGAMLAETGATRFIIDAASRAFGRTPGGPAKVAVISSGLMGSLSGSAVANVATTGTFTIPMMRHAGFTPRIAAGIEAAASSGAALVPPVMGAGAYMMLEIIQPAVTYLEIIRAAAVPAALYYLSLFLIVHFHARRLAAIDAGTPEADRRTSDAPGDGAPAGRFAGVVFVAALVTLVGLLVLGFTAFRAVSVTLLTTVVVSQLSAGTRLSLAGAARAVATAGRDVVPLVAAAACVGIIIGVVTLTGVGTRLPAVLLPLASESLLLALGLIMISSIVLGMGLPSAVTYLLLATLIGPVLGQLGAVPLAVHLFIFYFGMMSMVTPPVALAAYAAASIAGADIMKTGLSAFRFALVGFTLPYIFVFRPELLLLSDGRGAGPFLEAVLAATFGVAAYASALAGFLFRTLSAGERLLLFAAAALLLVPGPSVGLAGLSVPVFDVAGLAAAIVAGVRNRRRPA